MELGHCLGQELVFKDYFTGGAYIANHATKYYAGPGPDGKLGTADDVVLGRRY